MSTDVADPRTPVDPEAEFLAEMDAAVSGWPVRDGSDLLATATRVRDLTAGDSRARLDPVRQQEIWGRIMGRQRITTPTPHESPGRPTGPTTIHARQNAASRVSRHRSWRPGGWLATAVAVCLLALLAVPLVRELVPNGNANAPAQLPAQTRGAALGSGNDVTVAPTASGESNLAAPPATVLATSPASYELSQRIDATDSDDLLHSLGQSAFQYDFGQTESGTFSGEAWPERDTDLRGTVGGLQIVRDGDTARPVSAFLVFHDAAAAAQRLKLIRQSPGVVTEDAAIGPYTGIAILDNFRVTTVVQVGKILVLGYSWTSPDDGMSAVRDLQYFRWQSMREAVDAIAFLDMTVQGFPTPDQPGG